MWRKDERLNKTIHCLKVVEELSRRGVNRAFNRARRRNNVSGNLLEREIDSHLLTREKLKSRRAKLNSISSGRQ